MGTTFSQQKLGSCDFIDVLEEAVLHHAPVRVKLSEGESFVDEIVDVVTEGGKDIAVFREHDRIDVKSISMLTREDQPAAR